VDRPVLDPQEFEVDRKAVESLLDRVSEAGRKQLTEVEALQLFQAYGIPTVPHKVTQTEDETVQAAEEIGFPVVLKVLSHEVIHKTDVGGVKVDLRSASEVSQAFRQIHDSVTEKVEGARIEGILVEGYQREGREVIVGMYTDPQFGPILMFGMGGIYVEALKDVTFRVHPVTRIDAEEMIRAIRGFPLLEGVRGEPGVDLELLTEVIQRVSQLVGDHERIAEMDLNPFMALESGGVAVDARVTLTGETSVSPSWEGR
jgi:acyl-CoA synthetase (NDP forming)